MLPSGLESLRLDQDLVMGRIVTQPRVIPATQPSPAALRWLGALLPLVHPTVMPYYDCLFVWSSRRDSNFWFINLC